MGKKKEFRYIIFNIIDGALTIDPKKRYDIRKIYTLLI
jgi:hypothetical protein